MSPRILARELWRLGVCVAAALGWLMTVDAAIVWLAGWGW